MSRNGNFRMSPMMANGHVGTAYAPDAERSAEGDILYGLREDDASLRIMSGLREDDANMRLGVSAYDLRGLREDDANLRLGDTKWDGATSSAEGSAEGHRDAQLGISAYDLRGMQPGMLVSDGRMGGLVEDHYDTRLMAGLREDDANLRLGGLREDDASVRLGVSAYDLQGLREDDANLRLGGLREDDANMRLGTAYADDAAGSAEDPASRAGLGISAYDLGVSAYDQLGVSAYDLTGLREDDAHLRLGDDDDQMGVSAYDLGISAYDLGDVDSLNAEAAAIEQEQTLADFEIGTKKGMKLRNIVRNAARVAFQGAQKGTIASRAEADQFVSEKARVAGEQLKQRLQARLTKIDSIVADAINKTMAEWGPKIDKALQKKVSVAGVRMGYILRGLREDDADIELGRRRAKFYRKFGPGRHMKMMRKMSGAEGTPPEMLNATGFHERFPVVVDIAGMGRIHGQVSGAHIDGLFDFLKPDPSPEEYLGKIRLVMDGWKTVKPQLDALSPASKASIEGQMVALGNDPYKYDGMAAFLADGMPGYKASPGRWDRVKRLEAYLPTVQKMVTEARAFSGVYTQEQANKTAATDLKIRQESIGEETFLQKAAPVAAAGAGAVALTALVLAIA